MRLHCALPKNTLVLSDHGTSQPHRYVMFALIIGAENYVMETTAAHNLTKDAMPSNKLQSYELAIYQCYLIECIISVKSKIQNERNFPKMQSTVFSGV